MAAIEKKKAIMEEIEMFTLSVNPNKRKGKTTQLKIEEFDNEVYARNTTGFLTSYPVKWSIAIENYINEQDSVSARWRYKKEPSGSYSEANIFLYFEKTNCRIFNYNRIINIKFFA